MYIHLEMRSGPRTVSVSPVPAAVMLRTATRIASSSWNEATRVGRAAALVWPSMPGS